MLYDLRLSSLRQQKQELENIWQASLKNIEEASRLEARETEAASQKQAESDKREHDHDDGSEETPNKRQRILLKLQEESGECHGARIYVVSLALPCLACGLIIIGRLFLHLRFYCMLLS